MSTPDPILIPTSQGAGQYSQRTRLDGRDYNLTFTFNQREGRWYLAIADESYNPIVGGVKLTTNWPLISIYHWDPDVPPGELVVVDSTGDGSPPGYTDLGEGRRCQLLYMPVS